LPLVYDELRRLAAQKLAHEAPGQTLQATALVHEAYLRLVASGDASTPREQYWSSRGHFFAAAAEAMRRILVEQARRRNAAKRGGQAGREQFDEAALAAPEPAEDVLALDDALTQLATVDPVAARLVQLRFFGGLNMTEAAQALGMSVRSAHDVLAYARSWLRRKIVRINFSVPRPIFLAELVPGLRTGDRGLSAMNERNMFIAASAETQCRGSRGISR
jgi:RNA polymerase sigma factor (TIGR02999 family)